MTYDQFVAKWTGVGADWDHAYGYQCVDLFNFYNRDVVGQTFVGTRATGGAADLWNSWRSLGGYTKVPNSPTGVPPKGAVVVWAANTKATGPAGHVGIANGDGNTSYFVSFDQNYPTGSLPHMQRHSYDGVLGWYVPTTVVTNVGGEQPMNDQQEQQAYQIILGRNREGGPSGRTGFQFVLDAQAEVNQQRAGANQQIAQLQGKVGDLTTQNQGQQASIDALNGRVETFTKQLEADAAAIAGLQGQLKAAQTAAEAAQAKLDAKTPDPTTPTVPGASTGPGWLAGLRDVLKSFLGIK